MILLCGAWFEFCDPCGDANTVTNGETGETVTLNTLFERLEEERKEKESP